MRGSPIASRIDYAVAVKKENSARLIFVHKATRENIFTTKITQTTVVQLILLSKKDYQNGCNFSGSKRQTANIKSQYLPLISSNLVILNEQLRLLDSLGQGDSMRVCVCVCVRACVRACVYVSMCTCMCVYMCIRCLSIVLNNLLVVCIAVIQLIIILK